MAQVWNGVMGCRKCSSKLQFCGSFGFVVGRLGKIILTLVSLSWWALGDAPVQQDQPRSTGAVGCRALVGQPPPVRRSECDPGLAPARRAEGGMFAGGGAPRRGHGELRQPSLPVAPSERDALFSGNARARRPYDSAARRLRERVGGGRTSAARY